MPSRCDVKKNAAGPGGRKEKRMGNFAMTDFTRFVNQLQEEVDTWRRHPEAARRARQRAASRPAGGLLSGCLRACRATRGMRLVAVRLERAARRRVPRENPRVRTAKRASGTRSVRHVGSRRVARVATPPGGDDSGGPSSEPPAQPAHFARPFRSAFQKLGFSLLNRSFSSPLWDPGALMAFALLLERWSR